ncbi:MAG TPA: ABC transporter permease [Firmicutes bacterium]|nr:ABC transporter permease [Bacillota bacterium]
MTQLRQFLKNPSALIGVLILSSLILISIFGPMIVPYSPYKQNTAIQLTGPTREHWLGTDEFGRDVLSRLIVGSRYSLSAGFVSVGVGLVGGLMLGAPAGYYGGIIDKIVMLFCDIMLAFPGVLLSMAIVMVMGPGIYTPMLAVGISSIPTFARLVRAQFLSLRSAPYVEAARCAGTGDAKIIRRHLLPNSLGPVVIQATLRMGSAILTAATLSFLGQGAQPPDPEWGAMLNTARPYFWTAPYLAIFPGLAITITVIAINLVGDALRDYLDPRLRRQ